MAEPPPPSGPGPGSSRGDSPPRVVLVDDDGTALRVLGSILVEDGCDLRSYPDPDSALKAMEKEPPDVLVVDWLMPGMDGPGLLHEVRASNALRGTYCVLVTAFDKEGRKVEGLLAGADDYLAKPVSPAELLARVRVGLRVRRLERQSMMLAMAATLGHEINNPLTGVLGYLELVRAHISGGDRERALADIDRIEKAAERIRAVVARLLELDDPRLKPYLPGTMMIDLDRGGPKKGGSRGPEGDPR